jgi:hypothetical protein
MLKNTKEIVFYDPIVESGHIEFNQLFMLKYDHPIYVYSKIDENGSYLKYHLKSIGNHYKFLNNKAREGDVFLAFNNLSLFILTFLFKKIDCSFIVHNNLDFAFKSKIHKLFYKRIARKVNLIYLENRLQEEGEEFINHKSSVVIPHPIIKINSAIKGNNEHVFVSGRNLTKEQLNYVCKLEENNNVICNTLIDSVNFKNLKMGFIQNFDEMLNNCKKIYIIGSYKYRASGILYKALSLEGLEIIFSDKKYFKEIKCLKVIGKGNNILTLNENLK